MSLDGDFVQETYLQMKSLIEPRSIAIVGASDKVGKVGGAITRNIMDCGYLGRVYLVNPRLDTIFGRKVYHELLEIPEEVDLVEAMIPAHLMPPLMQQAARKRVKGVIIVSGGFAEIGNWKLQGEVVKIAKENGIRVIGPNCFGILNTEINLDLTFTFTRALRGSISFVSQSGAMCCGTLDWASQQEIGFSKFINLGNKCDVDEADVLIYLARDDQTKIIALYIEGFKNGRKFFDTVKLAAKLKPIIAIKSGVTEAGSTAALTHTGSITGSDIIVDAAFRQAGIVRINDVEDLFDASIAFMSQPLPKGENVAIVSNAGGLGVITADWCCKLGLQVPKFSNGTVEKISKVLLPIGSPNNSVDMTGAADYDCYRRVLKIVSEERSIDCIITIFVSQGLVTSDAPARAIAEVFKESRKPMLAFFMGGTSLTEGLRILKRNGVPTYSSPGRVARAASALVKYSSFITPYTHITIDEKVS